MATEEVPVLIVGGGPAGLCAALFLARHGVRTMLVERRPAGSDHPRARGLSVRSMELLRELGLEGPVRHAARGFPGYRWVAVDTLTRANLARARSLSEAAGPGPYAEYSPSTALMCPQNQLEPVLLAAARGAGVDVRTGTEMTSFEQDGSGVSVALRDSTGKCFALSAQYMIAADGARSPVREALGIGMSGVRDFGQALSVFFRADLSDVVSGNEFTGCIIRAPAGRGTLLATEKNQMWSYFRGLAAAEHRADYPPERCREIIRAAVASPALDVEIRSVLEWQHQAGVAQRFAVGRVFLAGDAAHVMPVAGGSGANTGIHDAHNLAWKLAARLRGIAGPDLPGTYETERQKIAAFTVHQSVLRTVHPALRWDPAAEKRRELIGMADLLTVQLGYRYGAGSSAAPARQDGDGRFQILHGLPGTRAPHGWVTHQGRQISTLDLFGPEFVVLTGPGGERWCQAARRAADERGIGLSAYRVGPAGDLIDPAGQWPGLAGVGTDGALLVRPDGFVAWRAHDGAGQPLARIHEALAAALGW